MKFKIIKCTQYDQHNMLIREYFVIKYLIRPLGLFDWWRTVQETVCGWGDSYRTQMEFKSEEAAQAHINTMCKLNKISLDRIEKKPVSEFSCDNQ